MKITKLTAENVKRLSAVEVTPDGNLVVVGGKNGAGKSSVLDSIMYALAGTASIPSQPIRNGAKGAKITLELDGDRNLIVERTMSPRGGALVVRVVGKAAPLSSPQALLDTLCGKIAFDPLEFTRLKPREQLERLRNLVGLDFTELDSERETVFAQRTQINRDAKAMKARIDAMPQITGKPENVLVVSELMDELKRRRGVNEGNKRLRDKAVYASDQCLAKESDIDAQLANIADLEQALTEAKAGLESLSAQSTQLCKVASDVKAEAGNAVDLDAAEVEARISSAEAVNVRVHARHERTGCISEWEAKVEDADECSQRLLAIDAEKQGQMENAAWPVPGLGFDLDGVTYNDLPFDQASSAEALEVSLAIGAAFNPVLRVMLIRDGSLLDNESLATIANLAAERDLQVWIERVGEGEECSVVIRDGHVRREEDGRPES